MTAAVLINPEVYLSRMAKPLQEKLKVARFVPAHARRILDVGCADGVVTCELAKLFPEACILGIDLDGAFLALASGRAEALSNVEFRRVYLRELLSEPQRFDTVTFVSVLHEFFSYGEGISSVLKALADAREILVPGGDIVIRDMILPAYMRQTTYQVPQMLEKVRARVKKHLLESFEARYGSIQTLDVLNHFLLKYLYEENWEHECAEHYVPVTFEQYEQAFGLLGMEVMYRHSYLLPYLRDRWTEDFSFTEDELVGLCSTGFLVARK